MGSGFLKSILLPIFPEGTGESLARAVGNGVAASRWLHAGLHLVCSSADVPAVSARLSMLGFGPAQITPMIHEAGTDLLAGIPDAARRYEIDLLIFGMNSLPLDEPYASAWQNLLVEIADVPVMICPIALDLMKTPIQSLLVPMSGEPRISASLEVALRLANEVGLPVDLLHITEECAPATQAPALDAGTEHFFHEYPKLIDQIIAQGSPFSGLREKLVIREFCHCAGEVADEVVKHVEDKPAPLLVLEWKGSLATGRARTIKSAMARKSYPILLVREAPKQKSILKVGNHFNAA